MESNSKLQLVVKHFASDKLEVADIVPRNPMRIGPFLVCANCVGGVTINWGVGNHTIRSGESKSFRVMNSDASLGRKYEIYDVYLQEID